MISFSEYKKAFVGWNLYMKGLGGGGRMVG